MQPTECKKQMDRTETDPIREEALDWLLKVESASGDPSLEAALVAWRAQSPKHEKAYRSVDRMWRVSGSLASDKETETVVPMPGGPASETSSVLRLSPRGIAASIAALGIAACLLLAILPAMHVRINADHTTGTAEVRNLTLHDGSALVLDAESAVSLIFDGSHRAVNLLSGQAYFDVVRAAGRPFTVSTEGLIVTVHGTGFAVQAGDDSISVSVAEGKVEVTPTSPNARSVFLRPGDKLRLNRATGAVAMSKVSPSNVAAWRDGQLVANGMTFAEVVDHIARYRRGVVMIPDKRLAKRRITGVFNLAEPTAALRAAANTQRAQVSEITPYLLLVRER